LNHIDTTTINNIRDFVELGMENSLTLSNTNIYCEKDDVVIPFQNIFRESYRPIILRYCKKVKLSDDAFDYYKYKPKTFSYNLYGTVDLWHLILWLNDMTSILQFTKQELIALDPSALDILATILKQQENYLIDNKENPIEPLE
jgi:hypothetical protein